MKGTARVAAIVPLFNGRRFIREAIDSILGQELRPREIIVVDDGSSDGGGEAVARYPEVRLVRQPNGGEAAARNRGIRESSEPLIAFLDQDDLWQPRKLAVQVPALEADPSIDMVFGQHRLIVEDDTRWFRQDALGKSLTAELPGSLLVRRSAFDRIGPFREDMQRGSDVDWILRARDAGMNSVAGRGSPASSSHAWGEFLDRRGAVHERAAACRARFGAPQAIAGRSNRVLAARGRVRLALPVQGILQRPKRIASRGDASPAWVWSGRQSSSVTWSSCRSFNLAPGPI